eukprot:jgi/Chlat1/4509/Chrsp29S04579
MSDSGVPVQGVAIEGMTPAKAAAVMSGHSRSRVGGLLLLLLTALLLVVLQAPVVHAAKWTVMIYLMADNNLGCFGLQNLAQLTTVIGAGTDVNFYVLADLPLAGSDYADCTGLYQEAQVGGLAVWGGAKELVLQQYGQLHATSSYNRLDLTNPAVLSSFIQNGISNYTADHYFLILWDHGGGWGGYGSDDYPNNSPPMTLTTLQSAISSALDATGVDQLDIIGFDACLMSNYEMNALLAPLAKYTVASEELEPGHGWDYGVFQQLVDNSDMAADALGKVVADGFLALSKVKQTTAITLAVVDTAKSGVLATSINDLAAAFGKAFNESQKSLTIDVSIIRGQAIEVAELSAQLNGQLSAIDLGEFLAKMQPSYGELESDSLSLLADAGTAASKAYNETIIYFVRDAQEVAQGAKGMSIYFPISEGYYNDNYLDNTGTRSLWLNALSALYRSTNIVQQTDGRRLTWKTPLQQLEIVDLPDFPGEPDTAAYTYLYSGFREEGRNIFLAQSYVTADGDGNVRGTWDGYIYALTQENKLAVGYASQRSTGPGANESLLINFDVLFTPQGLNKAYIATLQAAYSYANREFSPAILYVATRGRTYSEVPPAVRGTIQALVYITDFDSEDFSTLQVAYLINNDKLVWAPNNPIDIQAAHVFADLQLECKDLRMALHATDWAQRNTTAQFSSAQLGCKAVGAATDAYGASNASLASAKPMKYLLALLLLLASLTVLF